MARQEDTFKERLKQIFRINKPTSVPTVNVKPLTKEIVFTPELLKEISTESPAHIRVKVLRELCEIVAMKRLEENAVESVWLAMHDLLEPNVTTENRHLALKFLEHLIRGQYEKLGILRAHFFRVVKGHALLEDCQRRLELFKTLTKDGKDLTYFEEDTGPFLLQWFPDVFNSGNVAEFLMLLMNILKYNAAYMDHDIIAGFIHYVCQISNKTRSEEDLQTCLNVFDAVICYSVLPSQALYAFVTTLCRLVNIEKFCQVSWKLMRNLLGTHLGHSGIYVMCSLLKDNHNMSDFHLLRGAIFFIGMAMWGSRRVSTLKHTMASVLPSVLQAVSQCNHPVVSYEVVLSLGRLVKKYGKELQVTTWDIIIEIIEVLISQIETVKAKSDTFDEYSQNLHDLLTTIEQLYEQDQFYCSPDSPDRFFSIIEKCANCRPESSVLVLISYKAEAIHPTKGNWILHLCQLMEKYYRSETRTQIRIKALGILSNVLNSHKDVYEDELIEQVVLPQLTNLDLDQDVEVRNKAVELLVSLAKSCQTAKFIDILDHLEKVVCRNFTQAVSTTSITSSISLSETSQEFTNIVADDASLKDAKTAALGLVNIFKNKIYRSQSHAVRTYDLLIAILKSHYEEKNTLKTACEIRQAIFECLLLLRADSLCRLGFPSKEKENKYAYSPYLICDTFDERTESFLKRAISVSCSPPVIAPTSNFGPPLQVTVLPYAKVISAILDCLEVELDWPVMKLVLNSLPDVMQNKTLILSAYNTIDKLCSKLCTLVNDPHLGLMDRLLNIPPHFTRSDFHSHIFPVLTCLASYHKFLDKSKQIDLVGCLKFGLVSKCAKICVSTLTVCTLEMHDIMVRQVSAVLVRLSQISATVSMASPMLEFLSSLIRLPKLYANFVGKEYMSIFAIALPYTNPFKFNHYTVSLAHHVIAMWFLKCRLPFRRDFVSFINKGLKANVLRQFEETSKLHLLNQDSSERGRIRSFNETMIRRRPNNRPYSVAGPVAERHVREVGDKPSEKTQKSPNKAVDEDMSIFHKELSDTCIDMMARYTFSSCSSMPKRTPVTEFILSGGQSQSWLIGNKLVTITTSGGGNRVSGLCEKCENVCRASQALESTPNKQHRDSIGSKDSPNPVIEKSLETSSASDLRSKRRRHQSAAVMSVSNKSVPDKPTSQDDIQLHTKFSEEMKPSPSTSEPELQMPFSSADIDLLLQSVDDILYSHRPKATDSMPGETPHLCSCWCQGWAEVYIRRPTGNVSWMMRVQNDQLIPSEVQDFPLDDISSLFLEHAESYDYRHARIDSESLGDSEYELLYKKNFDTDDSKKPALSPRRKLASSEPPKLTWMLDTPPSDLRRSSLTTVSTVEDTEEKTETNKSPDILNKKGLRKVHSSPNMISEWSFDSNTSKDNNLSQSMDQTTPLTTGEKNTVINSLLTAVDSEKIAEGNAGTEQRHSPFIDIETKMEVTAGSSVTGDNSIDGKTSDNNNKDSDVDQSIRAGERTDEVKELPSTLTNKTVRVKQRGHTVAIMMPVLESSADKEDITKGRISKEGLSPSFVFLQLYHNSFIASGDERPKLVPQSEVVERAIKVLDRIPAYETHKIGVLYVGPGQATNETEILSNVYGSSRYAAFLSGLGTLLYLKECNPEHNYVGGLDTTGGADGQFAYSWHDDIMQVIYHVATLMPNRTSDPNCNAKKLHIGNDYVTIVYNNSSDEYKIGTIKGQFNYVNIVIQPLDHGCNSVTVQARPEIAEIIGLVDIKLISDAKLAVLARQLALHANLASMILQRHKNNVSDPYASNWLERLRQIKRLRQKINQEKSGDDQQTSSSRNGSIQEDFTDYV
ncbi:tuberin-like [Tubulanus polymorphus]|uniref:tuberin-like n=1 Tax=Tubulanus polymorphus TaxID=672921 RepID=UPI003DA251F2